VPDIKVITFDLDNTLWDVDPALLRAEEAQRQWLLANRPGSIEDYDHDALWEFKKSVWQRHPQFLHNVSAMRRQMLLELQLAAGFNREQSEQGAELAFGVFLEERHRVVLYEEALGVLQSLSRSYTLGALTNGNADIYKTDAGEYFDFAFLAEEVGVSKPAPDMFHAALEQSGVTAGQIVHVGDNPGHDISGAQNVGMYTVWMNSQGQDWPGGDRADREIDNLLQLPDAIASIVADTSHPRRR
jgi:FMN hydrolase / 5-amino-6-(5-phospho-D-ribitylamino)uracil phosphatase